MKRIVLFACFFLISTGLINGQQFTTFGCYGAPVGKHYEITNEYITNKNPKYRVIKESHSPVDSNHGCQNGYTDSSRFSVQDGNGTIVGDIYINGNTHEIQTSFDIATMTTTEHNKTSLGFIFLLIFLLFIGMILFVFKYKKYPKKDLSKTNF